MTQEYHPHEDKATAEAFEIYFDPDKSCVYLKEKRVLNDVFILPLASVRYLRLESDSMNSLLGVADIASIERPRAPLNLAPRRLGLSTSKPKP